ncbi:ABC transporter ATP-binding protein [Dyella caseinilytica]|uniref:ABC-type dipeptide transporter n=1 Tax=Dyella caseinilytica TaxID=1849581 RepID=A0ABX7GYU4_9GAMM|nr:ABC transporter ATP-binding protein [Dyella caseinilytica]QRN55500.1 ABC transporter ATP-binding protein [Dyella caseinilytica]GGA02216.1 ABC transporter ATP-binding protein [Dyella caseinilytica]
MAERPLLRVEQLEVLHRRGNAAPLAGPLSFEIESGATGLVGESGSGKSLTARALMNLLPPNLQAHSKEMRFDGCELSTLDDREWQALRGASIAMVMQDPRHALNPRLTIGEQIGEALRLHTRLNRSERLERVLDSMNEVGLPQPSQLIKHYPHQLSGGMGQRVMLAIALVNRPRLLIADEPTSALDASLRDQVLDLMMALADVHKMSLLLISHDLPLVARHCRQVLVMYRGQLVDRCSTGALHESASPYTRALWNCRPDGHTYGQMLPVFRPESLETNPS